MTEAGKIDRPDASDFTDKKKVYFVRNVYLPKNASDTYKGIFSRYWDEVEVHLDKLEKAGKISKIFCESIYMSGEEALKVLGTMNARLEQLVKKRIANGGEFLPLEDKDIFGAFIDWNNCLMLVRTERVHEAIDNFLKETIKDRFAHIKSILEKHIAAGEAGLLVMREDERAFLDLPDDMERFLVTPPAYDDLLKLMNNPDSGKEYWRT